MKNQLEKFISELERLCPDWREARFIAALSGGLDSTALTRLAAAVIDRERLATAHLNHRLRGEEAEADQAFAAALADELKLTFVRETRDVAALAAARKKGLEEAARRARYDFLPRAAREFGAKYILMAHQADDQAETVLLNLLKGAGGKGLAGIPPLRVLSGEEPPVILARPLLPFSRDDLREFLLAIGQGWREDRSNQSPDFLRNRLRLDILPRLVEFNPAAVKVLGRTAAILRDEEIFWDAHVDALWNALRVPGGEGEAAFSREGLMALSLAERRRVVHRALMAIWRARENPPEPVTYKSVEMVLAMLAIPGRHGGLDLPGGLRASQDKRLLRLGLNSRFL